MAKQKGRIDSPSINAERNKYSDELISPKGNNSVSPKENRFGTMKAPSPIIISANPYKIIAEKFVFFLR